MAIVKKVNLETNDFILIAASPVKELQLNAIIETLLISNGDIHALQVETIKSEPKRRTWIWSIDDFANDLATKYFVKTFRTESASYFSGLYTWHRLKRRIKWQLELKQNNFFLPNTLALLKRKKPDKDIWQIDTYLQDYINIKTVQTDSYLDSKQLIEVMYGFTNHISKLHTAGFVHGDLKWSNLMWHPRSKEILIVDWDNLRKTSSIINHANDIARFLVGYLEAGFDLATVNSVKKNYLAQSDHAKSKVVRMEKYIDNRIEKLRRRKNY